MCLKLILYGLELKRYQKNVIKVIIADDVTSIGDSTFRNCNRLKNIRMPYRFGGQKERLGIPAGCVQPLITRHYLYPSKGLYLIGSWRLDISRAWRVVKYRGYHAPRSVKTLLNRGMTYVP